MTGSQNFDASKSVMRLPTDDAVLKAVGQVAIAHGHLEYVIRMTIRSLIGMTVTQALDATQYVSMRDLRDYVRKLFQKKTTDRELRLRMNALLTEAERLTDSRNGLIHRTWGESPDGTLVIKGDDHSFGPSPTVEELNEIVTNIYDLIRRINNERMYGFIDQVVNPPQEALPKED